MRCLVAFEMATRYFFIRLLILKNVACTYQPEGLQLTYADGGGK